MNRWLILFFFAASFLQCVFIPSPLSAGDDEECILIVTPEQAAEHAANLANERAGNAFGKTPFTPQSYPPLRTGERWYWGVIQAPGICGYSAEIEFNTDGSDPSIRVVLHTDILTIMAPSQDRVPIQMEKIEENLLPSGETGTESR